METGVMQKIILLGGPTASGKSALALEWAHEFDGEIVNADSMQIYQDLDILTACPSKSDMAQKKHHLYRILKGDDPCSAERWRDLARTVIDDIWSRGKMPIIVGGTGLYFKTLVYGLSKVPDIDPDIRQEIRHSVSEYGSKIAYEKLRDLDPEMALSLSEGDSQRVSRALEVLLSTGKSLKYWQSLDPVGGLNKINVEMKCFTLIKERAVLYERCDLRFKNMIENKTAIEEVASLMSFGYDSRLPVMKSLGVPQIMDFLKGNIPLEDAIILGQTATRQFAKRQMTWFKNQLPEWNKYLL
jgi:tRNA dimethylallyltransferase